MRTRMKLALNENALVLALVVFNFVFLVSYLLTSANQCLALNFPVARNSIDSSGGDLYGGFMVAT